jgi:hypothetical protein
VGYIPKPPSSKYAAMDAPFAVPSALAAVEPGRAAARRLGGRVARRPDHDTDSVAGSPVPLRSPPPRAARFLEGAPRRLRARRPPRSHRAPFAVRGLEPRARRRELPLPAGPRPLRARRRSPRVHRRAMGQGPLLFPLALVALRRPRAPCVVAPSVWLPLLAFLAAAVRTRGEVSRAAMAWLGACAALAGGESRAAVGRGRRRQGQALSSTSRAGAGRSGPPAGRAGCEARRGPAALVGGGARGCRLGARRLFKPCTAS